jgi:hypothetical protein
VTAAIDASSAKPALAKEPSFFRPPRAITRKRWVSALAVAAVADILQLALFPAFSSGATSPFDDVLDAVVAISLLAILGFRWRLAIALVTELIPAADLFPTWTAVVLSIPVDRAAALPPTRRA